MEAVGMASSRGPVRVGELCAPRRPRHAPRHCMVPKISDHGDSAGVEGLTDKKELSCLEKHQIQAPAQMISQLRKNSCVSPVPFTPNLGMSNTTEETSPEGQREGSLMQDDASSEMSKQSNIQMMQNLARHSIKHSLTQKPNKVSGILSGNDKPTSQQCISVGTSVKSIQAVDVDGQEMNSQMHNSETLPVQTGGDSSVDGAACAVSQVSFPESENRQNKLQHLQSENRQNVVQYLHNPGAPDTSCLVSETKSTGSPESVTSPPFMTLLTARYKHLQTVEPTVLPPSPNTQHNGPAIPPTPVHHISKADPDKFTDWDNPEVNPFNRKVSLAASSASFSESREGASGRANGADSDVYSSSQSGRQQGQNGPDSDVYSSSQSRRHQGQNGPEANFYSSSMSRRPTTALSSKSTSSSGSSGCKSLSSYRQESDSGGLVAANPMSYCKLELNDRGRSFCLTLVSSELSNLMEICSLVSGKRDAKIMKFGASTEDLVDEMSQQIGVPLVMEKLRVLPAGGRYSAEELVNMSVFPSARKKPTDWNDLIEKFEDEGLEGILLRSKQVKYFEPGERRLPDGEKTYRMGDHCRPRDIRLADQDDVPALGPRHAYSDPKIGGERRADTEDWGERDIIESEHDTQLGSISTADTRPWAFNSPSILTIQATKTGRTTLLHRPDAPFVVPPTLL